MPGCPDSGLCPSSESITFPLILEGSPRERGKKTSVLLLSSHSLHAKAGQPPPHTDLRGQRAPSSSAGSPTLICSRCGVGTSKEPRHYLPSGVQHLFFSTPSETAGPGDGTSRCPTLPPAQAPGKRRCVLQRCWQGLPGDQSSVPLFYEGTGPGDPPAKTL